jgi:ssRNA-specific RNase YbeY (16S rRNA maturation enzyme)
MIVNQSSFVIAAKKFCSCHSSADRHDLASVIQLYSFHGDFHLEEFHHERLARSSSSMENMHTDYLAFHRSQRVPAEKH